MWLRSGGIRCEPWMEGRQLAWLRRFRWGMVCMGARAGQQLQWPSRADDAVVVGAHTVPSGSAAGLGGAVSPEPGAS